MEKRGTEVERVIELYDARRVSPFVNPQLAQRTTPAQLHSKKKKEVSAFNGNISVRKDPPFSVSVNCAILPLLLFLNKLYSSRENCKKN